ncbi:MAG: sugar-binding domain-containing protein, partial [Spirochaetota bacterium]
MEREISLNGIWEFSLDSTFSSSETCVVSVPGCLGVAIPALQDYRGIMWYRKRFKVNSLTPDKTYLLHFGGVNYYAEVTLNGNRIGTHEGGYTPFHFNVTSFLKIHNELILKVLMPGEDDPSYPFREIPHGKQEKDWYGAAAGIWKDVSLFQRGRPYVSKLFITPQVEGSRVLITGESEPDCSKAEYELALTVIDPDGNLIAAKTLPLSERVTAELPIRDPKLWDVESPNLYTLVARILSKGNPVDELSDSFGMRQIKAEDGEIYLNGKRIFIIGALDQDFYPMTHYSPPSEQFVRDELMLAKEMGFNCLRCHLKVPHSWYLKWADRLGILIWEDLPNWATSTSAAKERGKVTLEDMAALDYNHPSVVIRTIINESWGLQLETEEDRLWLEDTYNWLKGRDPTRLVVDNSACSPNFHVKTDIEDFHNYFAFPAHFSYMKSWIADFSRHPEWTFAHGYKRRGHEPLVLSEFGNWGLPDVSKLRKYYGGDPWWFTQGNLREGTIPLETEDRYWEYGLNTVFDSLEELAKASQDLQAQALCFQIEAIRKHPAIKGYVITELTDLYWEANGLLDVTRGRKIFFDKLGDINALDLVFPEERPSGIWSDRRVTVKILFSHLSSAELENVKIHWNIQGTEAKGSFSKKTIPAGLSEIGDIEFTAPKVSEPKVFRMHIHATSRDRIMSKNEVELLVVPRDVSTSIKNRVSFQADSSLNEDLYGKAHIKARSPEEADIIYASGYTTDVRNWAEQGKVVIIEMSDKGNFCDFGYRLQPRQGV